MEVKDSKLHDALDSAYQQGRKDAIDEVCEWLKNNLTPLIDNTQRIAWSYWVIKELRKKFDL